MEKSRVTADRVRPILQAMERSIDSARRRRLHGSQPQSPSQPLPSSAQVQPLYQPPHQQPVQRDFGQPPHRPAPTLPQQGGLNELDPYDESVPRQKARPKRPSPMMQSYDDPDYRAQAG